MTVGGFTAKLVKPFFLALLFWEVARESLFISIH
jgi:hypothetical protein